MTLFSICMPQLRTVIQTCLYGELESVFDHFCLYGELESVFDHFCLYGELESVFDHFCLYGELESVFDHFCLYHLKSWMVLISVFLHCSNNKCT